MAAASPWFLAGEDRRPFRPQGLSPVHTSNAGQDQSPPDRPPGGAIRPQPEEHPDRHRLTFRSALNRSRASVVPYYQPDINGVTNRATSIRLQPRKTSNEPFYFARADSAPRNYRSFLAKETFTPVTCPLPYAAASTRNTHATIRRNRCSSNPHDGSLCAGCAAE